MSDIPAALGFTRQMGWPHREQDWRFHLRLGAGLVATDLDLTVVGTMVSWKYGDRHGTLGLAVVDPRCQRRGIGARLLEQVVSNTQVGSLSLVATKAAQKLYRRHGFRSTGQVEQHQGNIRDVRAEAPSANISLRQLHRDDLEILCKLDGGGLGFERRELLKALLPMAQGMVLERHDAPVGFALLRRSGIGQTIGPVVVRNEHDAVLVLSHLLARNRGFCRIDIHKNYGRVSAWLEEVGLPTVDEGTVMVSGPARAPPSGTIRSIALVSQALA